jgi:hypothetical protein
MNIDSEFGTWSILDHRKDHVVVPFGHGVFVETTAHCFV